MRRSKDKVNDAILHSTGEIFFKSDPNLKSTNQILSRNPVPLSLSSPANHTASSLSNQNIVTTEEFTPSTSSSNSNHPNQLKSDKSKSNKTPFNHHQFNLSNSKEFPVTELSALFDLCSITDINMSEENKLLIINQISVRIFTISENLNDFID